MSVAFSMSPKSAAAAATLAEDATIALPVNSITRKCCTCGSFTHKTRDCPKLHH
ncbi:hypothetical protein MUCCIDRAFT_113560 [Mucor lusitanicus CBS 277.49]|uniref:Uncharacterized protein n=1 Tax=Mucor lusitanicus CBS 277.49 TaxID=747725 RepID=A0A168IM32_MUCCL|nr:hypothetical protein MUCCIDRAFT_113560 [Mucor lusitanicus CBS 277.49]